MNFSLWGQWPHKTFSGSGCAAVWFPSTGSGLPLTTNDTWQQILRDALEDSPEPPIRGTSFRAAVERAAARKGVTFPPADQPEVRFAHFVGQFPDIVTISRRPGQDMLIVPAGRADLLAASPQSPLVGIRKDLFEAFTQIRGSLAPFYDRDSDSVIWETTPALRSNLVPVPPASQASELDLRREFAKAVPEPSLSMLLASLNGSSPLYSFGNSVREQGLQRQWHAFRTERVMEKIQRWATESNISWRDAWLTSPRRGQFAAKDQGTEAVRSGESLNSLLDGLDSADLQRIAVPLDLVLKALRHRREH